MIKIELSGEIIDEAPGKPVFHRGIHSFPTLGSIAHRIRAADLRAIYSIRGAEGIEIGRLTQNETIPATVNVKELVTRHFAVVGSTGVGKTTAVSMLLKTCLRERPNLRVIILDPHNEYAAHFTRDSMVLDLGQPRASLLDVQVRGDGGHHLRRPQARFGRKRRPIRGHQVRQNSFRRAANLHLSPIRRPSASEGGFLSADTPVPYRVSDAVQVIEEWMGSSILATRARTCARSSIAWRL